LPIPIAVIWYLSNDARLSARARQTFSTVANAGDKVGICAITIVEMVYLVEKNRITVDQLDTLITNLRAADSVLVQVSLTVEIAESLQKVSRDQVPDMPDRIIAATALYFGVPVISRDGKITASSVTTIW